MQADISHFLAIPNLTRYRNCLLTWKWWNIITRMTASRNGLQPKPNNLPLLQKKNTATATLM